MREKYPESFMQALSAEPNAEELWDVVDILQTHPALALPKLETLAERGSVLSMVYIGDTYVNGRGVKRDVERGDQWYIRAARAGSVEAAFRLALADWQMREYQKSIDGLLQLSERGFTPAMCCLGAIYASGKGVVRDIEKAFKYWKMAEASGNFSAKQGLSYVLRSGEFGFFGKIRGYIKLINLLVVGGWYRITYPKSDRFRCWK